MRAVLALLLVVAVACSAGAGDNPDVYAYITFDPGGSEDMCHVSGLTPGDNTAYVCLAGAPGGVTRCTFELNDVESEYWPDIDLVAFWPRSPFRREAGGPFGAPSTLVADECVYGAPIILGEISFYYWGEGACCIEFTYDMDHVYDCTGGYDVFCIQSHATIDGGACSHPTGYPCPEPPPPTDLTVEKTSSTDPVAPGDDVVYQITVSNGGPANATDVVLTDNLPPSVNFVSAQSSQGTCSESGGVVECELGDISIGNAATITINGVVAQMVISNTAQVIGAEVDPDYSDNTATCVISLECPGAGPNEPPVASAGEDQLVDQDETVCMAGSATDPNGDLISEWQWSFTNLPYGSIAELSSAASQTPCFSADVSGDYVLSLVVSDSMDWSAPDYVTVTATAPCLEPVAVLDVVPTAGDAPLEVTFDGSGSYDPSPSPDLYFEWDFGDGTGFGWDPIVVHTYTEPGEYDASLYLYNGCGEDVTVPISISVTATGVVADWTPQFALYPSVPNPFTRATTIAYDLARETEVNLAIYDVSGRLVRQLRSRTVEGPGRHKARWDGRDAAGNTVASGMYVYRLETPEYTASGRMTLVK